MIVAKEISKNFGNVQVLQGVHLHVHAKEVVSIIGASGSGKSTLLHILGTLVLPDSGTFYIHGKSPVGLHGNALAKFRQETIGFVFQFHQLLPEFTAVENIMLPALIAGKSKKEAKEMAMQWMDKLGLAHRVLHKPDALSGGEQQRVAVARALVNKPSVILADEPSGNLDARHASELHDLFFQLRDETGVTFLIVTHNDILAKQSDRALVLENGLLH